MHSVNKEEREKTKRRGGKVISLGAEHEDPSQVDRDSIVAVVIPSARKES